MQEISRTERHGDTAGWIGRNVARTALLFYAFSLIPTSETGQSNINGIFQLVGFSGLFIVYPMMKTLDLINTRKYNKLLNEKQELLTVLDRPQFIEYRLPYIELIPCLEKLLVNRFESFRNLKNKVSNISEANEDMIT